MKYQLVCRTMKERKVWSPFEDKILRYLKQERGEKKWSVIARKMEEEFQICGRTGKQCRERYHNHLDSAIVATEWTQREDELLQELHEEYGNKWSSIAQNLPGRSDNCVKNRFYSKLRKSVRRLNKFIIDKISREYEPISSKLLSKIIETTQLRYRSSCKVDEETIDFSIDLKNRLFHLEGFIKGENIEGEEEALMARQLVEDIFHFQLNFKRPGRVLRKRTSSFDEKNSFLHPKTCLKMNRSISNASSCSENSEDHSINLSSSNLSSFDEDLEEEEQKPRKRSLTTRSSKEMCSRNNSDVIEVKNDEVRSNGDDPKLNAKQTQCELNDANFIWMNQNEKLSMSLIEEYPMPQKGKQRNNSISSNSNKSNGSNRSNSQKQFKSYDEFCSINEKFLCNMNIEDPVPEIVWRILEPIERDNKLDKILEDDDPILPSEFMQE